MVLAVTTDLSGCWTVIVAAGSGSRFDSTGQRRDSPGQRRDSTGQRRGGTGQRHGGTGQLRGAKQFQMVAGKPMLQWSIDAFAPVSDGVVVVVPADAVEAIQGRWSPTVPAGTLFSVVPGGSSRAESVRSGLAEIPETAGFVLVHDAARPAISSAVIGRVLEALTDGADSAIPVIPVTDTLRNVSGGAANRDQFVAVQTPQGFVRSVLIAAHASGNDATDDASLVDQSGGNVVHVQGDPANLKVTVASDLQLAEILLA